MSSTSVDEVIPGKEQEKDELSMKAMMLEMQKQIASLTMAVLKNSKECQSQTTPQKRKSNSDEPSSSNAKRKKDELENITDSEDESDEKNDGFDNLVANINEPECEIIEDGRTFGVLRL